MAKLCTQSHRDRCNRQSQTLESWRTQKSVDEWAEW